MIYRITFEFPVGPPEVSVRQYDYITAADVEAATRRAKIFGEGRFYPGWKAIELAEISSAWYADE